jgi:hypothetical protein
LTRTGQFPGMSCLLLRADGVGWGWWDHCAGGWDLSFLLFLLESGDEIKKCDDS